MTELVFRHGASTSLQDRFRLLATRPELASSLQERGFQETRRGIIVHLRSWQFLR
jgi:hypothetical protein